MSKKRGDGMKSDLSEGEGKIHPVRHQNSVCRNDRQESNIRIREKNDLGFFSEVYALPSAESESAN